VLFSNDLEQATNFMDNMFNAVEQSYQQDKLLGEMEQNSRLISDAQLHLSNQLNHQDFIRRYER